ncbi:MAG: GntR family transcriptional regulator [Bacillaceae bacterium]|nr:GntR family transcriptional regulator [Bacillaceae bacterium]
MPIPKDYSSPVRMSAKERAFNQLQKWIIDGTLEPGEKLFDKELAEALGISRTPIREALQLLEYQGFIEMFPGKETKVKDIQKEDVLKIYPPLASLQSLSAEITAKIITKEEIEKLIEINNLYREAIESNQPFKAMEYDEDFHNVIIENANNQYIMDFTSTLQLHIRRFKYVFLKERITLKKDSVVEHEKIIDAFYKRDTGIAAAIMKKNWIRPMEEVYRLL